MTRALLACPNSECAAYAVRVSVPADAYHGKLWLVDERDGECWLCEERLEPFEQVQDAKRRAA